MKHPVVLVILDGYGIGEAEQYNPIYRAKKPNIDSWLAHYPHAALKAAGLAVGLPEGSIGNSEVGHLTLGSGRILEQPIAVLNKAIDQGTLHHNKVLCENLALLQKTGKKLHVMGLLSDANVHSNVQHLYALLKAVAEHKISEIIVHPFLDGRDVAIQSAPHYLTLLEEFLRAIPGARIGSIHGRLYAMDRDNNWQRTEKSYQILTQPQKKLYTTWRELLNEYYAQGIFDEFIPPSQHSHKDIIDDGDGIIFFNTRPDRARQLTACFMQEPFEFFNRHKVAVSFFITPFSLGNQFKNQVLFQREAVPHTLIDSLVSAQKTIFTIAETEKYAHITYFFNGGREEKAPLEKRVLIKSAYADRDYARNPCMQASNITQEVIASLQNDPCDFYLINYANADMLGHSGNFDAIVQAVECLDKELGKLYTIIVEHMNGTLYITADHGNAEKSFNGKNQALTAHTANLVPFIMVQKNLYNAGKTLPLHELADVASFILHNLALPIPHEIKRFNVPN